MKRVARLKNIPGIGVDQMGNAADASNNPHMLRLENLDTDISPPEISLRISRQSIGEDRYNSYLPFLGLQDLREAAVARVERVSGVSYDWNQECVISAGGMSGILNCLLATVQEGDEIIVTDPTYAGIINRIYLAGATPVYVPLVPSEKG